MNHMKEIAKMLGVELGEEFEIDFKSCPSCKTTAVFTENEFRVINTDACIVTPYWGANLLQSLLKGDCTIKRKPWKPRHSEVYFTIELDGEIERNYWNNTWDDKVCYKIGNCYRTEQEAFTNRDKWISFYASDEVLEV